MFGKLFKPRKEASEHPTTFDPLHEKAFLHCQKLEEFHEQRWQTDQAERYDADLAQKRIWWTFKEGKIVEAHATLIGTWSEKSYTFLWGWDHPVCPPADNSAAKAVLAYAEKHNIIELKLSKVELSEADALQVATIGVLLGNLEGLFAAPGSEGSRLFIGFGGVQVVEPA